MLSISEKIYCEGNNNNISYSTYTGALFESVNPATANKVIRIISTCTLKIATPIRIGQKYKAIINYTNEGLISPTFTGFTNNYKYFTASSNVFTFEVASVDDYFYLDSVELIELTSTVIDVENEDDIVLNKFSGAFTELDKITGESTFNFNVILNEKSDFIRYPNDNRVSYRAVLNGIRGLLVINNKTVNNIDVQFFSDKSDLIEKLKNTTLKQCDIANEVFSLEANKSSDTNCFYNYLDSYNYTRNNYKLIENVGPPEEKGLLNYELSVYHQKPAVKVIKLFNSIFNKIGYSYNADVFSLEIFKNLGVANYQYYKENDTQEHTAEFDYTFNILDTSIDELYCGLKNVILTNIEGDFDINYFKPTKNSCNNFKFKGEVDITTETTDSAGNEYPNAFIIDVSVNLYVIDYARGFLIKSTPQKAHFYRYDSKKLNFEINFPINVIDNVNLRPYIEITTNYAEILPQGSNLTFEEEFDYSEILTFTVNGEWSMNENDNLHPAKEYPINKILPEMTAYDFIKSVINTFGLQVDFINNKLLLYSFEDYYIRQSSVIDLTNKIDKSSIEKIMPSDYLNKNYKFKYLTENQNEYYFDEINIFTSNNCDGENIIKIPFNLPTQRSGATENYINHLITPFNNIKDVNPYKKQEEIKGNWFILQNNKSLCKDIENENGVIIQLESVPIGSNNFRNQTLSYYAEWFEQKTGVADLFLQSKINELKNANGYKLTVDAELTQYDYDSIKKNTLVNIEGQKYIIDKLSGFNSKKLTKLELIKTNINNDYVGNFEYENEYNIKFRPRGKYVTDTFSTSTYSSGSISQIATTVCASSSVCKLKVLVNDGFEYSTDESTWVALPVGTEITLNNNADNQYYVRLNDVVENTYKLKLQAVIDGVVVENSLFTYVLIHSDETETNSTEKANIKNDEQVITNEIVAHAL